METTAVKNVTTPKVDVCCLEFDPSAWKNNIHVWYEKMFIRDSVHEIFHVPLPSSVKKVITKLWHKASNADALPEAKDNLLLGHDPSPWKGEYYLAVTKEVPGADNVALTGTFVSKIFDGPYHKVPVFIEQMNAYLAENGKKAKRYFFHYAYCPECAKKYGHNYIVVFAEI